MISVLTDVICVILSFPESFAVSPSMPTGEVKHERPADTNCSPSIHLQRDLHERMDEIESSASLFSDSDAFNDSLAPPRGPN